MACLVPQQRRESETIVSRRSTDYTRDAVDSDLGLSSEGPELAAAHRRLVALCSCSLHKSMPRTEEVSKKKKPASTDGSKTKKEADKPAKDKAADKKKPEPTSAKVTGQKAKDTLKDKAKAGAHDPKSKALPPKKAAGKAAAPPKTDDYLGDFDLPSSSDEEEFQNGHQPLYTAEPDERELKPKVCSLVGTCPVVRHRLVYAAPSRVQRRTIGNSISDSECKYTLWFAFLCRAGAEWMIGDRAGSEEACRQGPQSSGEGCPGQASGAG